MTLLACGMCGGVVELAAVGGIAAGSVVLTDFYNRIRAAMHNRDKQRKQAHRNDRHVHHNRSK